MTGRRLIRKVYNARYVDKCINGDNKWAEFRDSVAQTRANDKSVNLGCIKIFESLVHNPDLKELNELRTRISSFLKLNNGKSRLLP